jgi:hypothetical protein
MELLRDEGGDSWITCSYTPLEVYLKMVSKRDNVGKICFITGREKLGDGGKEGANITEYLFQY